MCARVAAMTSCRRAPRYWLDISDITGRYSGRQLTRATREPGRRNGGRMRIVVVIVLVLSAVSLSAQRADSPSSPVADATRKWLRGEAKNLIAAAEEMPADKYGFRPTPAQMTFAKLMTHVVESNRYMCSA